MARERKPWHTPELIVLARSRPEEAVLAGCKVGDNPGPRIGCSNSNCKHVQAS